MKPIHYGRDYQVSPEIGTSVVTKETRQFINAIFIELQASFPAWRYTFATNESLSVAKITWMKALRESGITSKAQIAQGLRIARQSESHFFPSVGQFISWCRTADSVPDVDRAFGFMGDYLMDRHHVVPLEIRAMFDLIDRSMLRTKSERDIYRTFKRNYRFICDQINAGCSIDEYLREPVSVAQTESFEQSEERRLRVLSEILKTRHTLGFKR